MKFSFPYAFCVSFMNDSFTFTLDINPVCVIDIVNISPLKTFLCTICQGCGSIPSEGTFKNQPIYA